MPEENPSVHIQQVEWDQFLPLKAGGFKIVFFRPINSSWRFPDLFDGRNTEIPFYHNHSRDIGISGGNKITTITERCIQVTYRYPIVVDEGSWEFQCGEGAFAIEKGDTDMDLVKSQGGNKDDIGEEYHSSSINTMEGWW